MLYNSEGEHVSTFSLVEVPSTFNNDVMYRGNPQSQYEIPNRFVQ